MIEPKHTSSDYRYRAQLSAMLSAIGLALAISAHHIDPDPNDAFVRHDIREQCIRNQIGYEFSRISGTTLTIEPSLIRSCVEDDYAHYVENVKDSFWYPVLSNSISIFFSLFSLIEAGRAASAYRLSTKVDQNMPDTGP